MELMCDAVLCIYNAGNVNGALSPMGTFVCLAPEVHYADPHIKCSHCGEEEYDIMDCLTYTDCRKRSNEKWQ